MPTATHAAGTKSKKREIMKKVTIAFITTLWLASVHAAGSLSKVMPEDEVIFVTGRVTVGHDVTASGHYTQIVLDQPEISPCDHKLVRTIMIWNMNVGDHMQLASYTDERVAVMGTIVCPMSGIIFAPDPNPKSVIRVY